MPNLTVICYLFSLWFYGMGNSRILILQNAVTEHIYTSDNTLHVSIATSYFVLAIFFAVIGSLFFYVKNKREQELIIINGIGFRGKSGNELNIKRPASIIKVKSQLTQSEYGLDLDLDKIMSS